MGRLRTQLLGAWMRICSSASNPLKARHVEIKQDDVHQRLFPKIEEESIRSMSRLAMFLLLSP